MYSVFEQFKIFKRLAAKCHFLFVPRMPNKKSFMLRDVRLQAVVHITTKMLKKNNKTYRKHCGSCCTLLRQTPAFASSSVGR
jgi:hypothetical protein